MKKYIRLLIPIILVILLSGGCKKDNKQSFSWDYNNTHYTADSSSATAGSDTRVSGYSGIYTVTIDGGRQLVAGTYTLSARNTTDLPYLYYGMGTGFIYSESGTVTISYNDNTKISGSFSATMVDGTVVSGGFNDVPLR